MGARMRTIGTTRGANEARRRALQWLATQLAWEATLDELRVDEPAAERRAA